MAQEFIINAIKLKCAFYDSKIIELVKNELESRAIVYSEDLDVGYSLDEEASYKPTDELV
jgi:hypothetical protein